MEPDGKKLGRAKLYRSVALRTEIYNKLERIGKKQDRSVTWLINTFLEDYVYKYNEGLAPIPSRRHIA